jgi:ferredoxin
MGSVDLSQQYDISRDLPTVRRYFEDLLASSAGASISGCSSSSIRRRTTRESSRPASPSTPASEGAGRYRPHRLQLAQSPDGDARVGDGTPGADALQHQPAFDLLPASRNALDELTNGLDAGAFGGFDPERQELYATCERRGVGINVMKTLGAGKLLSPEHTPFRKPLTVPQCVHYALSRPAVASVLLGCKTRAEVEDAMAYLSASEEERDYTGVLGTLRVDFRGNCVYCGHCQPCPAGIDIAAVNKYLDIARLDETKVPPSIRSHYASLAHRGGECVACGSCESRCPFGVQVADGMAQAARIFGD